MKRLLALTALLFAFNAHGATYYFSDCQPGAHIDCVPGNDTNDGLSAATPFKSFTKFLPTGVHTRLFAKGGAWAIVGERNFFLPQGSAANPNVWDTYTPSWGPGTAKPIWVFTADANNKAGISMNDGTSPSKDEGYVWRGIELRGPGYLANGREVAGTTNVGTGFLMSNDVDHVLIDNVTISGFVLGVSLSGTAGNGEGSVDTGANHKNEYIILKNSEIFNNSGQGWLGAGWHLLVENNIWHNNGFKRDTFDHNIYITSNNKYSGLDENGNLIPWGAAHMIFRGNWMTKSNYNNGTCNATSFVGHYRAYDVVIENNTVYEPEAKTGCYGIQMNALNSSIGKIYNHAGTIVRGNRVILGGLAGLGIGANGGPNIVIENNTVVYTGTSTFTGIDYPHAGAGDSLPPNGQDLNGIVRNNSVYMNNAGTGSEGIRSNRAASTKETIVSNLIVFGPNTRTDHNCFDLGTTKTIADFAVFDRNLCYRVGGDSRWSTLHSTLSAAQAAGFDTNSSKADPLLVATPSEANNWSMQVQTGSPAINAGHPSLSSRRALDSKVPVGARDIGAHDFGATSVAPATPTRLQIN